MDMAFLGDIDLEATKESTRVRLFYRNRPVVLPKGNNGRLHVPILSWFHDLSLPWFHEAMTKTISK
jgi:hypothetical protein